MRLKIILLVCLAFSLSALAVEISGVKVPDAAKVEGQDLKLNGAGVRTRMFMKIYVGALYLEQKASAADAVLADKGVKRMALHIMRDLKADVFSNALQDGMKANNSTAELAKIDDKIKEFNAIVTGAGGVKKGDVVQLDYLPVAGTRIVINGDNKGAVSGEEFYRALIKIWLGEKPIDSDLKKSLLGL
ncbi:MAG: chalcone isomerase family protein [Burkholderiales bacterium]